MLSGFVLPRQLYLVCLRLLLIEFTPIQWLESTKRIRSLYGQKPESVYLARLYLRDLRIVFKGRNVARSWFMRTWFKGYSTKLTEHAQFEGFKGARLTH